MKKTLRVVFSSWKYMYVPANWKTKRGRSKHGRNGTFVVALLRKYGQFQHKLIKVNDRSFATLIL